MHCKNVSFQYWKLIIFLDFTKLSVSDDINNVVMNNKESSRKLKAYLEDEESRLFKLTRLDYNGKKTKKEFDMVLKF